MIETPIFGDKSTKHQHYDNGGNVSTMKWDEWQFCVIYFDFSQSSRTFDRSLRTGLRSLTAAYNAADSSFQVQCNWYETTILLLDREYNVNSNQIWLLADGSTMELCCWLIKYIVSSNIVHDIPFKNTFLLTIFYHL
jgi:hypothetical protein